MSSASFVLLAMLTIVVLVIIVMSALLLVERGKSSSDASLAPCETNAVLASIDSKTIGAAIPLHWNDATKTYDISFTVGKSVVSAAFDTGSAATIIRTPACSSCSVASVYDPAASSTSRAILSSNGTGFNDVRKLCRASISYVSQTNVLQMYSETVIFNRVMVSSCAKGSGEAAPVAAVAPPLIITDFPVGGMVESTGGHASVNVFGISGVKSTNHALLGAPDSYPTSTCKDTSTSTYEAPILESIATETNSPFKWSVRFSANRKKGGALVAFGNSQTCLTDAPLQTVRALRVLPNAPSDMVATPWRYYVIEVLHARSFYVAGADNETGTEPNGGAACAGAGAGSTTAGCGTPYPDFPKYLILDTATTQFMVPGEGNSISQLTDYGLIITLNNAEKSELRWSGRKSASQEEQDEDYGPVETPLFGRMSQAIASEFSDIVPCGNVGILGALAMRGRYIEFSFADAEHRSISFA